MDNAVASETRSFHMRLLHLRRKHGCAVVELNFRLGLNDTPYDVFAFGVPARIVERQL